MKRAFTTSEPNICSLVAGLFISTLLIELIPIGPPALASEIGANDFRISDMAEQLVRVREMERNGELEPIPEISATIQ